jgi:hypothetical protein
MGIETLCRRLTTTKNTKHSLIQAHRYSARTYDVYP